MCMTAVYVRAQVQSAESEGARDVTIKIKDMREILAYVDAGIAKERAEGRPRPAGWISPHDLRKMRESRGNNIRMSRKKSPERCLQVFHLDILRDSEMESVRLVAEREEDQRRERELKEAQNVPSIVS